MDIAVIRTKFGIEVPQRLNHNSPQIVPDHETMETIGDDSITGSQFYKEEVAASSSKLVLK